MCRARSLTLQSGDKYSTGDSAVANCTAKRTMTVCIHHRFGGLKRARLADQEAPQDRLRAIAVCKKREQMSSVAPPYVGKWFSGAEVLWSALKRR